MRLPSPRSASRCWPSRGGVRCRDWWGCTRRIVRVGGLRGVRGVDGVRVSQDSGPATLLDKLIFVDLEQL